MRRTTHILTCMICLCLVLHACAPDTTPSLSSPPHYTSEQLAPVHTAWRYPLTGQTACSGSFVAHDLPYQTNTSTPAIHLFESNGAGVAVGDLDQDGQPEIVFANLAGPSKVLWNRGQLQFEPADLEAHNTRAVALVDQDGDGNLDIAFTQRGAGVSIWHNLGARRFAHTSLRGVLAPAYSMAWTDLTGAGKLDLITGSYDAERSKENPNSLLDSSQNGIYVYRQETDRYTASRLADNAQALAIATIDIDQDGQRDLVVGNDFGVPDAIWLQRGNHWQLNQPFKATSHSTMSFDWGDIDNSGHLALLATDMKPFTIDVKTLAAWLPMMQKMPQTHPFGDRQIMANVLQTQQSDGTWQEQAATRGIDATGWSWSGLFGDLDNDGLQDVYVVNGMMAPELFPYLPNSELIEANQAFRNTASGHFESVPDWNLASTGSGRGMMMADLDSDGDLDIVVNNLGSPAQLFENQLCGGAGLEVDLNWPDTHNTHAIGAKLMLYTSIGVLSRDVRATSGYLSGNASRVHFGIPRGATLERLDIQWPDGRISPVEGIEPQILLVVTR